jgi:hypothetical protein
MIDRDTIERIIRLMIEVVPTLSSYDVAASLMLLSTSFFPIPGLLGGMYSAVEKRELSSI